MNRRAKFSFSAGFLGCVLGQMIYVLLGGDVDKAIHAVYWSGFTFLLCWFFIRQERKSR